MITLTHNVAKVRTHLEQFGSALSFVPEKTLDPEWWKLRAQREAETVLMMTADRTKQYMIPEFVRSIMAVTIGLPWQADMTISMERVKEAALNLKDLTDEQRHGIWARRRQLIDRESVSEWVAQAKERTAQDMDLSDDELTDRLLAIFFGPANAERDAAAWALLFGGSFRHTQHLLEHMAENRRGFIEQLIGTGEIDTWLRAVLDAWRKMLLEELPVRARTVIREAWG